MSYQHLTAEEREIIYRMNHAGAGPTAIGRILGRSAGTITREIQRNSVTVRTAKRIRRNYSAVRAHQLALTRRRGHNVKKKLDCETLQEVVRQGLKCRWSPEQIAGRLRNSEEPKTKKTVCFQTIYT